MIRASTTGQDLRGSLGVLVIASHRRAPIEFFSCRSTYSIRTIECVLWSMWLRGWVLELWIFHTYTYHVASYYSYTRHTVHTMSIHAKRQWACRSPAQACAQPDRAHRILNYCSLADLISSRCLSFLFLISGLQCCTSKHRSCELARL
jgi:hypothetical protein